MRKLLFISVLALIPLSAANAKTFKCVEDGQVSYQATPCKGGGGEINVLPPDEAAISQGDANKPRETAKKFDEQSSRLMQEQKLRDIEFETGKLQSQISDYQQQMNKEVAELQKQKEFWQRSLGGKQRAQGIDEEIKSVQEKYQAKIKEVQEELARLNKEKATTR